MSKSAFTDAHRILVRALAQARRDAGLHQADLAQAIGKDQSFVSNIERGQRRVDIVEFYVLAHAMKIDPVNLFARIIDGFPDSVDI